MYYPSNSILYSLISKSYLLTALFLFSLTSSASTNVVDSNIINNNTNYYHPNLETSYKVGNVRQIGRASILLPVFQKEDQLLYFNAIGMMDNKNNQEGNFGFGYRGILNNKDIILGSFIHYDRKSSPNDNVFNQGTLGLELFNETFELRANGYVSFSKIKVLHSSSKDLPLRHNGASVFTGTVHNKQIEAPLHGFDVELGSRIGQLPLSIYGGYYYFNRDGGNRVSGPSGRLDIKLTNWLSIGGEVKYDEIRKLQYYVGLNLRFSNSKDDISPYSLRSKMTQMPLRDVDVVTVVDDKVYEDEHPLILANSGEELFNMLSGSMGSSSSSLASASSRKLENIYIGLTQDVTMPEGYTFPAEFNNSIITGVRVETGFVETDSKNNASKRLKLITVAQYEKRKINGLQTQLLNKIANSKVSHLIINSGLGLVNKAYGNSEISYNENYGDIKTKHGFGMVGETFGYTKANNNINYGKVSGDSAAGVVGGMRADSQAIGNINHGKLSGQDANGIVRGMKDNSLARGNINHGEVSGWAASGVGEVNGNSRAVGNINYGEVSGKHSSGVVSNVYDSSQAVGNINYGEVSGREAAGVVSFISGSIEDNSQVFGNINYGEVSGEEAAGVVFEIEGKSQVVGNINYGRVSGAHAYGVVGMLEDNAQVVGNINYGEVSGVEAAGVVGMICGKSQVIGNINYGKVSGEQASGNVNSMISEANPTNYITLKDDDLASPESLKAKGIKLMEAKDIDAPWFLGKDDRGRNIIIPGVVAKREILQTLKITNCLRASLRGTSIVLPRDIEDLIVKELQPFSYAPKDVSWRIVDYTSLPFPKDDEGKVQARATKEEFLKFALGRENISKDV